MDEQQQTQARAHAYELLAQIFLEGVRPRHLEFVEEIPRLKEALPRSEAGEVDLEALALDEQEIFGLNVFPYADVFLSAPSLVEGDASDSASRFFLQAANVGGGTGESAGHLGSQLRFLARAVAAGGSPTLSAKTGEQSRQFLDEHLLPWLPALTFALEDLEHPFYRELGGLTLELAGEHRASLRGEGVPWQLAPAPELLDSPRTGLAEIVDFLLTPAWSGIYLNRRDLVGLAQELQVPRGFGSRPQMWRRLLENAASHARFRDVLSWLRYRTALWEARYQAWGEDGGEPAMRVTEVWRERIRATARLLDRLKLEVALETTP